jgi:1-acyl-sn-glycerol-3-phosphate acyltransferase
MDVRTLNEKQIAFRRALARGITRPIIWSLFRIRVHGRDNFPQSGPLIVVSNHFHWSEPGLIALTSPWDMEFLGAKTAVMHKWVGWYVRLYRAIPVERMGVNVDAVREVVALLRSGKVVGVFPEGRTHLGHLSDAWPGAAFLALKAKVPVLPVGVAGTWEAPSLWRSFKRAPVDIRVGEVFGPLQPPAGVDRKDALDWATQEIMSRIAGLLPERMRGAF